MCQHHKFGYCKFKQQCLKEHDKNKCGDSSACREIKSCRKKRHPKICRKFSIHNFCKFDEQCSYVHLSRDHTTVSKEVIDDIVENIKNIKAEVDLLKKTVKSLSEIKKERKRIKKSIEVSKEGIDKIKSENIKITNKFNLIGEEFESKTDENSDGDESEQHDKVELEWLSCVYCKTHFRNRKYYESHMEIHWGNGIVKCLKCLYSCENQSTLQKHMNTKHPLIDPSNISAEEDTDNNCDIEDE